MIRLFLTVLRMGLVSGYAVLIVLLVRMLLRRFPKRYSYLLWSAVLLRLVCPVMIKSPFSLVPDALSLYAHVDVSVNENDTGVDSTRVNSTKVLGNNVAYLLVQHMGSPLANGQDTGKILDGDSDMQSGVAGEERAGSGNFNAGKGTDVNWEPESVPSQSDGGVYGGDLNTGQSGGEGNEQDGYNTGGKTGGNIQSSPGIKGGQDGEKIQSGQGNGKEHGGEKIQSGQMIGAGQNTDMNIPFGSNPEPEENETVKNYQKSAGEPGNLFRYTGLLQVLCGIWISGILVFWAVWACTLHRFKKRLLGAVYVEEGVYETNQVAASFVDGIFRPVIYLATGLTGTVREYVLCHERVHIRRKDPFIKAMGLFLVSIYWFHPLVWLAFKKMCEDMEMSCDEWVVEQMGAEIKKEYSSALLCMAQGANGIGLFAAFGGNEVKSRVKNILSYRKPKTWLAVLLLLLVTAVGCGLNLGSVDTSAAGKNTGGQTNPVEVDAPKGKNNPDDNEMSGEENTGGQNSQESVNSADGNGLFGKEDVPDGIKEKPGIQQYEYPPEFSLGDDLRTAITQLALAYNQFDKDSIDNKGWKEIFVARFIQNSRASFEYLNMLSEKDEGRISLDELYYIHYSLTGVELDFSSYSDGFVNRYDDASSFNNGVISGWDFEDVGDGVVVTADFLVEYDGGSTVQKRKLTVNLAKNPYSCFDGYSIVSIVSELVDDAMEKYASVLALYHTALKEEWEPGKLAEEGFSPLARYCYGEDVLDKIGYAFLDLDGDGIEELLIGAIGGDDFIRQQVFELYCMEGGVPKQVFTGMERNRYYLCREGGSYIIINEGSSSASDGKWSCNVVREGKLFPVQTIVYDGSGETIIYGDLADPEHPEESASGEDAVWGSRMEAEEEEAQAVIRAYEEYRIVPEYVPFSDFQTTKTGSWEDGNMGKKASGKYLENQLNLILDQKEVWERTDFVAEGTKYTVTDLNGNGRLEIIAASCQGTGHYTYADIYEVSADGNSLVHYKQTVPEGDSQADIIWGVAPVYYNSKENVYRYVFDDLIRNGAAYYYEGKKSLELKEGQVLETTLAYRITEYIDGAPVVAYGGENGLRVTNEQEYQDAADQVFEGWGKGMAYFLWFVAPEQKDDVRSLWYEQLETSYQSFSVVEVSSDKVSDKDNSKTK